MISCLRFTASHLSAIVRRPTKTRRCFTQKKTEVRLHCSISGNYCKAARAFDINESTVRGMIDVRPLPDKMKLSSISKICERDCVVRSSGSEKKKHLTVVSSATDGQMLPPIIIFKGKTEQTICVLNIPPGFIVKTQ